MNLSKLFNKKSTINEVIRNILVISVFFSTGSILANFYGVHFNLSNSFKEKVFLIKKHFDPSKIAKYDYISTFPPMVNPYVPDGEKIIKQIICYEEQGLVVRGLDYYCDGNKIATALIKDSQDRDLEQFKFDGVIPKDHFFVIGDNPKSYDSRYFGFIKRKDINGVSLWRL